MYIVAVAVCVQWLLWSAALSRSFPDLLAPSIGDVLLVDVTFPNGKIRGTVEIYYEDGVRAPQWGYVCKSGALKSTAEVVCRQLGYSGGDLNNYEPQSSQENEQEVEGGVSSGDAPPTDHSDDITWLSYIHCEEKNNHSHILRCTNRTVSSDGGLGRCERLMVTCDPQPPVPYLGRVRLCPPNGFRKDRQQSTSFGVAQVYLHGDWGGVNQYHRNVPLGSFEADSICRQLGYTNAVASYTMTVKSARAVQSLEFACHNMTNTITAWFKTSDATLNCDAAQRCFSCCSSGYPSETPCSNNCSVDMNVVVKCEFDPTIAGDATGGSEELCRYSVDHLRSPQACAESKDWKWLFIITVSSVGSLAVLLLFSLVIVVIGSSVYCVRRRGNRHRDGDGRGHLLRPQDDEN